MLPSLPLPHPIECLPLSPQALMPCAERPLHPTVGLPPSHPMWALPVCVTSELVALCDRSIHPSSCSLLSGLPLHLLKLFQPAPAAPQFPLRTDLFMKGRGKEESK